MSIIEINKSELRMMMTEFWSLDNNDICEKFTQIFLKRNGLSDFVSEHPNGRQWDKNITKRDEDDYLETLEEFM